MTTPVLQTVDYKKEIEEIIYIINASNKKWGDILIQVKKDKKRCYIIHFKSGL